MEIIRAVEGPHLRTKVTLDMLGIPRTAFYRNWRSEVHYPTGLQAGTTASLPTFAEEGAQRPVFWIDRDGSCDHQVRG